MAHSSRLGRAAKISLLKGDGPLSTKIAIVPCNGEIFEAFIYQSYLIKKQVWKTHIINCGPQSAL